MLAYTFNDKKVFVSDQETDGLKRRLAANAQWETLSDREKRISLEIARKRSISDLSNKLKQGAKSVYAAKREEIDNMKLTPEEFQLACIEAREELNAELARIEAAKL